MATINEGLILKSLIELASMLDPFSEILSICDVNTCTCVCAFVCICTCKWMCNSQFHDCLPHPWEIAG